MHASWFVLRASLRHELAVRDALRQQGLRCYVPLRYHVETQRGHKVRRLVPAISGLVFVYGQMENIAACKQQLRETAYWLTRPVIGTERRERVVVPDKAMDDFIRVTEHAESAVTYFRPDEVSLAKGDRIRIHGGVFDGVEGVLLKVKGRRSRQLVVTIPDLAVAAVSIEPDVVELVNKAVVRSHDLHGDAQQLNRLAMRLLTAPPDRQTQPHEWNLLCREVNQLYQCLQGMKGYLPSVEAELCLSLLLAERALNDTATEATLQRCRAVAAKLKHNSNLKSRLLSEIEGSKSTLSARV